MLFRSFAWLSDQQYFKDYTDINTLMSLREKTEEDMEQDMAPFGFFDNGREEYIEEDYEKFVPDHWLLSDKEYF